MDTLLSFSSLLLHLSRLSFLSFVFRSSSLSSSRPSLSLFFFQKSIGRDIHPVQLERLNEEQRLQLQQLKEEATKAFDS